MKTIIYAVFATLCIHSVYCQKLIPEKKSLGTIGFATQLECLVTPSMDLNVSWVKENKENVNEPIVLSYGNKLVTEDTRFKIEKEIDTELYNTDRHTLTIYNLMKFDTGIYRCQAMVESNNIIFAKIELEAHQRIPATIFNNITSFVVVMEGRPLKLECQASGFPKPNIYWTRENNKVLFTGRLAYRGNILETPAAQKNDRGNYYCDAVNGDFQSPKRMISVIVEFPPTIITSQLSHGQALNYHVTLDCRIESCPTSTTVWMFNGMPVYNNQYYTISNISTSSKEVIESNLRINITEKHLYGNYICRTYNIFGNAEVTINVYETANKICPPSCD